MKRSYIKRKTPFKIAPRGQKTRSKAKNPRKTLWDKAWRTFSLWIRKRDGNICVTCNGYFDSVDAGHFIHKSQTAKSYFCTYNVHSQCRGENYFRGGSQDTYSVFILTLYGEEILRSLVSSKHVTHTYSMDDLRKIIEVFGTIEPRKRYDPLCPIHSETV